MLGTACKANMSEVVCCWLADLAVKTKMPIDTEPEICQRGRGALLVSKPYRLPHGQQRLLAHSSSPASDISVSKCEKGTVERCVALWRVPRKAGLKSEGDSWVPAGLPKGHAPRAAAGAPGPAVCPIKQSKN